MENFDLISQALELYKIASKNDQEEKANALDDLMFEHNEDDYQWPADIKQQRKSSRPPRPCLSINKIPEKIDKVEGEFRQLKPSCKIRGIDSIADPKIADIFSGIIRHIEYNSNARSAYNHSHGSVLKCGRGAWEIDVVDSEDDPFVRDLVIRRIANVMTVVIDPDAQEQDKSDANYMFIVSEMSKKQFEKKYPNADMNNWPDDLMWSQGWRTDTMIRVAKYWYKETVKKAFYRVKRAVNGIPTTITVKEEKLLETDMIVETKEVEVKVVKWCKMTSGEILDGPNEWPSKYIPIVYQVGRETNINGQSKTKGMVRNAKTPQQMYNFWSSSSTEQIALAPKAPYLATPAMLSKYQDIWDDANVNNYMYLLYEIDPRFPGAKPTREPPVQMSTAISHELSRMEHDIMSAMGIFAPTLGENGPEKSGKAILALQKQGSIGSYVFTDNFQVALIYSMKILIDLIPYVYDTERIIRIRGEDGIEKSVPVNTRPGSPIMQSQEFSPDLLSDAQHGVTEYINDMTVGKYDVAVTIGPSYDTQRQEALSTLMELVNVIPQFGPATVDLIVQNIDIPGVAEELIKRAKKIVPIDIRGLEPGEEPPPPPGPTHEETMEEKRLQLDALTEMRKGFEGKIDSIAKIMTAEAKERGEQFSEIATVVEELRAMEEMKQKQIQGDTKA